MKALASVGGGSAEPRRWIVADAIVRSKMVERTKAIVDGCELSARNTGAATQWSLDTGARGEQVPALVPSRSG
jgi:hypothetical protein